MANYTSCKKCDHELLADDIAIYRKLVQRNADEFLCMDCLAEEFKVTRADIQKIIDYYRKSGQCTLFC